MRDSESDRERAKERVRASAIEQERLRAIASEAIANDSDCERLRTIALSDPFKPLQSLSNHFQILSDPFRVLQSPSDFFRSLQTFPDHFRRLQFLQNPSNHFSSLQTSQITSNTLNSLPQTAFKSSRTTSESFRLLRTPSNPFRSLQTSQTISKPFTSLQIIFKPSQTHSESFRVLQIPSDLSRPLQITSGPSKSLQTPSDSPERALARSCVRALALSRAWPLATSHPSRARTTRARVGGPPRSVGESLGWRSATSACEVE